MSAVRDFRNVALAVGWRTLHNVLHNPSLLIPGLMFPLLNFVAFAGGLSRLRHIPGFDYPPGYAGFQFCFVLLQSAAFGGVFTGFGIARDFEYGFSRRLMLARLRGAAGSSPATRSARSIRWLITPVVVTARRVRAGHADQGLAGSTSPASTCSPSSSTSPSSSGPAASRCASSRCRPARSCRRPCS